MPMQPSGRPFQMCYGRTEGSVTQEKKMGKKKKSRKWDKLVFSVEHFLLGPWHGPCCISCCVCFQVLSLLVIAKSNLSPF